MHQTNIDKPVVTGKTEILKNNTPGLEFEDRAKYKIKWNIYQELGHWFLKDMKTH